MEVSNGEKEVGEKEGNAIKTGERMKQRHTDVKRKVNNNATSPKV